MRPGSANRAIKSNWAGPTCPGLLARLLLWLAAVALAASTVHLTANGLGWHVDVRDEIGDGRFLLLALAATGALIFLSPAHGQLQHFGMWIPENWAATYIGSIAAGALCCALSYASAIGAGQLTFVGASIGRWLSATTTACLAFAFAPLQEIVFRAYLLTLTRDRVGAWASVVLTALLFALTIQLHWDHFAASPPNRILLVGAFLGGTMLALMRLYHGSIVAPVGAVTGWIFVQIVMQRTKAVVATGDGWAFLEWLCSPSTSCSSTDPVRNPFAWCIFAVAIVAYGVLLTRSGSPDAFTTRSARQNLPLSFKKFYPFCSFVAMAPLDILLPRLAQTAFSVDLPCALRVVVTLAISAVNTIVSLPERLLVPWLLRHQKVPDPIFILGIHRSGTTHLHNLMALDPQFITPRNYQVMNPVGFLFSGWLFVPLMWWFTPWKRPMDAMEFSLFAPQEEEFAIACSSRLSPYWGIIFPRKSACYERYFKADKFEPSERAEWKEKLLIFLRMLCAFSSAQPLLKNPCNTGRIEMLLELFPTAKFIHLCRDPYRVYQSNMHNACEGFSLYQFQNPLSLREMEEQFLDRYVAIEGRFYAKASQLPSHQVVEVRYEDLDLDPIRQIERIYHELGIALTADYRARILSYLESITDFQKNTFAPIPENREREVREKLASLFQPWNYLIC
jgi:membrane protease YdiL (CAAX protease family)